MLMVKRNKKSGGMTKDGKLNVLVAGNEKAIDILPTLINSVIRNTNKFVNVVVLCRKWNRSEISTSRYNIEFVEYYGHTDNPNYSQSSANDILYFLPMMWGCDRCITLGWDELVVDNIDEYYDTEFVGDEFVTAVKYDSGRLIDLWTWKGKRKQLESIFSEECLNAVGFSGGSHVIDLQKYCKMRKPIMMNRALHVLGGEDHLSTIGVYYGHVKYVDKRFNALPEYNIVNPVIVHYSGNRKPWNKPEGNPEWNKYKTTWKQN